MEKFLFSCHEIILPSIKAISEIIYLASDIL